MQKDTIKLAPSILAADFARLGEQVAEAEKSAAVLEEILPEVDQVLVMTVNPGFGHQHFLESTLPKIRRVCRMVDGLKPGCEVEVDGGVDVNTAPLAAGAGANVFVAGSSVFGNSKGITAAMANLRDSIAELRGCDRPVPIR